jgi:hypothetical protein
VRESSIDTRCRLFDWTCGLVRNQIRREVRRRLPRRNGHPAVGHLRDVPRGRDRVAQIAGLRRSRSRSSPRRARATTLRSAHLAGPGDDESPDAPEGAHQVAPRRALRQGKVKTITEREESKQVRVPLARDSGRIIHATLRAFAHRRGRRRRDRREPRRQAGARAPARGQRQDPAGEVKAMTRD